MLKQIFYSRKFHKTVGKKALSFEEALREQLEQLVNIMRLEEESNRLITELKRLLKEAKRREPRKGRNPLPPYREKLHPRPDWQKKAYWQRIRSNPFRKNYH